MTGNTPNINNVSKCLNDLIAALIALAVVLVFYSYGQARIKLERERASKQTLYKVAELLELGDAVEKEAIHSPLRQALKERDVVRRMEAARTMGIRVDWDDIFDHYVSSRVPFCRSRWKRYLRSRSRTNPERMYRCGRAAKAAGSVSV